jgi:hypothetical protein
MMLMLHGAPTLQKSRSLAMAGLIQQAADSVA